MSNLANHCVVLIAEKAHSVLRHAQDIGIDFIAISKAIEKHDALTAIAIVTRPDLLKDPDGSALGQGAID